MPALEPDDERLIADLRRRAPDSLARLHRRYAVGIYNLALRMVHRREDAEDITHDVLIRAYERLPRDRDVRLRPWLYRVTLNRCYDHLRASARRRPADPERESHEVVAGGDPFEQAELGALFERTLETLSSRQQAALLLKDVHGCSTAELAVMLEVTPGSAEVLLARARTSFRTRFAAIAGVEPRAVPSWIGASLALPLVALPASLLAPPAPPLMPLKPLPDLTHVAAGAGSAAPAGAAGGIGSAIANSAALKLAAVLAATATMTTGVSDMHHRLRHRPPATAPVAAQVATPSVRTATAATTTASGPQQRPVSRARASSLPSASPSVVAVASTSPSPSPSPSPSATDGRLGDAAPDPTPTTSDTPSPSPAPSDTATPQPTPTASPTDTPAPSPSPSG